jgi:hypothetical protein
MKKYVDSNQTHSESEAIKRLLDEHLVPYQEFNMHQNPYFL